MLAETYRGLNETNEERDVLAKLAALQDDGVDTFLRLMTLDESANDWRGRGGTNAERFLAVNPLVPEPYRRLAQASEETGDTSEAVRCYQRMLLLDPTGPGGRAFSPGAVVASAGRNRPRETPCAPGARRRASLS